MYRKLHLFAVSLTLLTVWLPAEVFGEERLPVPERSVIERNEQQIRRAFADAYRLKTQKARVQLAERLLEEAKDSLQAAVRYVYLSESRELAVLAAETKLALSVVERMVSGFEVDALQLQLETLEGLAKTVKLGDERRELGRRALKLLPGAVEAEDYAGAERLAAVVSRIAKPLRETSQYERAMFFRRQYVRLAKEYVAVRKAAKELLEEPKAVEENSRLAKYYALYRCDLRRAMPFLERSDEAPYPELIGLDRRKPGSAAEQVKLAERWWSLAAEESFFKRDGKLFPYRYHFLAREFQRQAQRWYTFALPKLEGVRRVEVENRVKNWGTVVHTEVVGNPVGSRFESVRAERGLLVGLRYSIDRDDDEIASLKPMFQTPYGGELGSDHRGRNRGASDIVARPGYAVGGLVVKADRRIHGFRVIFMRVNGLRLQETDRYESPWIGGEADIDAKTLGDTGDPVVGFFGTAESKIYSIGLALKP